MLHLRREFAVFTMFLAVCSCALAAPGQLPAADPATPLQSGQALVAEGRLAEAEAPLTQAAALAPGDAHILTLLAELKARLGATREAVPLFRKAASLQPRSATAHLNLAIALADTGDIPTALAEVRLAIELDPTDIRARLNLARFLADAGQPSQARLAFQSAATLDPSNAEVHFFWASFEKSEHRPALAANLFAKVVAQQPENGQAYFLLGQCLQAAGRNREAIAAWQKAVALNPSSGEEVYALAQALRTVDPAASAQLQERFRAIESAKQTTAQVTELGNKAYQAMQQQSWSLAIETLQQAIHLCAHCPLEASLHQQAGLAMCRQGDLDAGERELRFALSLDPRDRRTVQALQWVEDQRIRAGRHPQ
jgi:tetratricopeptide (TPR) repeat protein